MNSQQHAYYEQIRGIVESKGGKVISTSYSRMIDKMLFQCANNHQWDTEARSIIKGMWCRYCHGNTKEQGKANFEQRVKDKKGKILGIYDGNHNRVLVECEFEHQWEILPYNLTVGKWCPDCNNKAKLNPKRFLSVLKEREGKLIGEYEHSTIPVEVECKNGHRWHPKPFYIVVGNWCPTCNGSNGEQIVALYLNNKNISYKTQATIPGLPRRRYDFIFELNGTKVVIEYDGEMHFKFIKYYHVNDEYYNYRRTVDKVKTYYALINGYKLIRLDYTQLLKLNEHLDIALKSPDNFYVSNMDKYSNWLLGAQISQEDFNLVNQGITRPNNEDDEEEVNNLSNKMIRLVINN